MHSPLKKRRIIESDSESNDENTIDNFDSNTLKIPDIRGFFKKTVTELVESHSFVKIKTQAQVHCPFIDNSKPKIFAKISTKNPIIITDADLTIDLIESVIIEDGPISNLDNSNINNKYKTLSDEYNNELSVSDRINEDDTQFSSDYTQVHNPVATTVKSKDKMFKNRSRKRKSSINYSNLPLKHALNDSDVTENELVKDIEVKIQNEIESKPVNFLDALNKNTTKIIASKKIVNKIIKRKIVKLNSSTYNIDSENTTKNRLINKNTALIKNISDINVKTKGIFNDNFVGNRNSLKNHNKNTSNKKLNDKNNKNILILNDDNDANDVKYIRHKDDTINDNKYEKNLDSILNTENDEINVNEDDIGSIIYKVNEDDDLIMIKDDSFEFYKTKNNHNAPLKISFNFFKKDNYSKGKKNGLIKDVKEKCDYETNNQILNNQVLIITKKEVLDDHSPNLRRSSRKSSQIATMAITNFIKDEKKLSLSKSVQKSDIQNDGNDEVIFLKKDKKFKLAPIFSKKSYSEVKVLSPAEIEILRIKKNFLHSGVPDALKKISVQNNSSTNQPYSDWHFPLLRHINQLDGVTVNLTEKIIQTLTNRDDQFISKFSVKIEQKPFIDCNFFGFIEYNNLPTIDNVDYKEIIPNIVEPELEQEAYLEILSQNSNFPVEKIYKILKKKKVPTATLR